VELYLVEHELKWAKAASLELWIHGYIHMSTNNALWCAKPLVRVSRGGGVFGGSGFTRRFQGVPGVPTGWVKIFSSWGDLEDGYIGNGNRNRHL